jgi:hypothetical protein
MESAFLTMDSMSQTLVKGETKGKVLAKCLFLKIILSNFE